MRSTSTQKTESYLSFDMKKVYHHTNPVKAVGVVVYHECRERDSNPHTLRYTILSRARLPIPPSRLLKILTCNDLRSHRTDVPAPPIPPSRHIFRAIPASSYYIRNIKYDILSQWRVRTRVILY